MSLRQPVVLLARTLAYIDVLALNREGKLYFPDLVRGLVEQFNFQKYPLTLEEYDLKKGVNFFEGKSGNQPIQKFSFWDSIVVVETVSGTDESKAALEEILAWGKQKFGLAYTSDAVQHFAYVSDVTFYSDAAILEFNSAATKLATSVGKELSAIWKEPVAYQPTTLKIGHDPLSRKFDIAPFMIERRGGVSFSQNKYFSEAPLPTHVHLELLEKFEQEILLSTKGARA
jgi:hypothetical protein